MRTLFFALQKTSAITSNFVDITKQLGDTSSTLLTTAVSTNATISSVMSTTAAGPLTENEKIIEMMRQSHAKYDDKKYVELETNRIE
jgi:hypothetical protein